MISYMVDGQGYLIISRDVVSEDIEVRREARRSGLHLSRSGEADSFLWESIPVLWCTEAFSIVRIQANSR